MGLIKAAAGAAGGVLADQWKEFFSCDSIPNDTLLLKGVKKTGSRSSNTKGSDNVITSGSGIVVSDGQCVIIVEQGVIAEICSEAGEYTYDNSLAPSVFCGNLGQGIKDSFKEFGKRFAMGGEPAVDQRVYYFNTKEILDNKFGTPSPIPFRVVDTKVNLDLDVDLRCSGIYSYRITDPVLFYKMIAGNVSKDYTRDDIDSQLKTEFINSLSQGMSRLSALEIRPNDIPAHQDELCDYMNEALVKKWGARGISVVSVALNPINLSDEDKKAIKDVQLRGVNQSLSMANATITTAFANSMENAASNPNGAMAGFMGMGMAMNQMGGGGIAGMMQQNQQMMQQQMQQNQQGMQQNQPGAANPTANGGNPAGTSSDPSANGGNPAGAWKCSCGATATGKFCTECGSPRPVEQNGWTCSCGAFNQGKFCSNCGSKKPAGVPQYKCDKCGWVPEDPTHPPKFCPECGDPFGDEDIVG